MSSNARWAYCSGCSTVSRRAWIPPTSMDPVVISKSTPSFSIARETSASDAPAEIRAPRIMSPAAPPTGWKWTCTGAPRRSGALLLAAAGELAGRQESHDEEDGQEDERTWITLYGVGEGGGVTVLGDFAGQRDLAFGGVDQLLLLGPEVGFDAVYRLLQTLPHRSLDLL